MAMKMSLQSRPRLSVREGTPAVGFMILGIIVLCLGIEKLNREYQFAHAGRTAMGDVTGISNQHIT
jgi:hypothetical protein